jgi:hypothetical protein
MIEWKLQVAALGLLLFNLNLTVAAEPATQAVRIHLDSPASYAALEQNRPEHYRKLREISKRIAKEGDVNIEQWLKTELNVVGSVDSGLWFVSEPPQKRLRVTLDATPYEVGFSVLIRTKPMQLN